MQQAYTWCVLKDVNFKTAYITTHPINVPLLIHGPCEPEMMMDPQIITNITGLPAYNLAENHADFADNYLTLHLYLQHQQKPACLFLYVTPESFDSRISNTFNTWKYAAFSNDSLVNAVVNDMDTLYARWKWLPMIKYTYYNNFTNDKAIAGLTSTMHPLALRFPNGYTPPTNAWQHAINNFRDLNPHGGYYYWDPKREKYLLKIIELARKENIRLVFYESPVLEVAKKEQHNRYTLLHRIDSLAHANQIPYLLFDTLPMAKDKKNYFTTLNTTLEGAQTFSAIFAHYIKDSILK